MLCNKLICSLLSSGHVNDVATSHLLLIADSSITEATGELHVASVHEMKEVEPKVADLIDIGFYLQLGFHNLTEQC